MGSSNQHGQNTIFMYRRTNYRPVLGEWKEKQRANCIGSRNKFA